MTDFKDFLKEPKKLTLEDRLYLVKRKIDKNSHIKVDQDEFKKDPVKPVLFICPAKVYTKNEETGECIINFDNCLECGTCQVTSRYVTWKNPNGGFGVTYTFG
jgi:ferredoxin like protein